MWEKELQAAIEAGLLAKEKIMETIIPYFKFLIPPKIKNWSIKNIIVEKTYPIWSNISV